VNDLESSSFYFWHHFVLIEFYFSLKKSSSVEQLVDIGCKWVILGHSERRNILGEDDEVCITYPICLHIHMPLRSMIIVACLI
jgi:hypothetical protein